MIAKDGKNLTREQWLEESTGLILDEILHPIWEVRSDLQIKVSVGYAPNTKTSSKVIGVCLSSGCSEAGYSEIFISPVINDSLQVLSTLVHEVIHAIDDCKSGHRGDFCKLGRKAGLEGKITATYAGETLRTELISIIDLLGDIPHAKVDLSTRKKQQNRNIKVWCDGAGGIKCGFKFNTSRSQISYVIGSVGEIACPACGSAMKFEL